MRHANAMCNAAIRSEEKGELFDASLYSESTTGEKQVAVSPAPGYFGRLEEAPSISADLGLEATHSCNRINSLS